MRVRGFQKAEHEVSGPPKKKTKTPKKEVSSKHIKTPDTSAATTPVVQTPEAKRHEGENGIRSFEILNGAFQKKWKSWRRREKWWR